MDAMSLAVTTPQVCWSQLPSETAAVEEWELVVQLPSNIVLQRARAFREDRLIARAAEDRR